MKINEIKQFPPYMIRDWAASDGINFAVALARITGWLLQVDWWSPTDRHEVVENMKSLQVYVSNNSNQIYDLRGKQTIGPFTNNIIKPLAHSRGGNYGGVVTRFYSENKLINLPLRVKANEDKIQIAHKLIISNQSFLSQIPQRQAPIVPAHLAAKFTYGQCNPFATALSDIKGYSPVAIIAKEYNKLFNLSKLGYAHSIAIDEEGNAVDSWGRDTIENIVQRFGITKYELNEGEHFRVSQRLKTNSPEKYQEVYEDSVTAVRKYFSQ